MTPAQLPLPRLFEGREAALAPLDALARTLWLGALVNSQGRLTPRLEALVACRSALVAGRLPDDDALAWTDAPLGGALRELLAALGLAAFCRGNGELADQVVSSLLWHLDRLVDFEDLGASQAQATARVLEEFGSVWRERCDMMEEVTEIFGECDDLFKNIRTGTSC